MPGPRTQEYYNTLALKMMIRLAFTYLIPLALLAFYFHRQYGTLPRETGKWPACLVGKWQALSLLVARKTEIVGLLGVLDLFGVIVNAIRKTSGIAK